MSNSEPVTSTIQVGLRVVGKNRKEKAVKVMQEEELSDWWENGYHGIYSKYDSLGYDPNYEEYCRYLDSLDEE